MAPSLKPFYLITAFWGDEFRRLFTELCLPSLLAPGNIPALEGRHDNRFVICTTDRDWRELSMLPIFRRLSSVMTPVLVEIGLPSRPEEKYAIMSAAHRAAVTLALEAKAYGVFVSPDAMLSSGSLRHLQELARAGKRCVLAAALRFSTEAFVAELERRGLWPTEQPLDLSGRELTRIALPHMHPETARYEWESPFFTHFPVCCFWRVQAAPDEPGIVLHSQSWGPMLVDYGALAVHDATTFDRWTLDGDYVYRNFGSGDDVHVIRDSDDLLYVSFTPAAERNEAMARNWAKGASLRVLTYGPLMDPLKRRLIRLAIRLHAGPLDGAWDETERLAAAVLDRELYAPNLLERAWVRYRLFGWKGFIPQSWRPWLRPFRRAWRGLAGVFTAV